MADLQRSGMGEIDFRRLKLFFSPKLSWKLEIVWASNSVLWIGHHTLGRTSLPGTSQNFQFSLGFKCRK